MRDAYRFDAGEPGAAWGLTNSGRKNKAMG
jgi:hypothetical protein